MVTSVMTCLGVGVALASAPGPVQAVLLTEAVRGGVGRGLRALAGVHLTFGVLMVGLALGLSLAPPSGPALRTLKVAGGVMLLWLAWDGLRSGRGGKAGALLAALSLVAGAAIGDLAVVLLGAVGVRRAGERVARWVYRGLAFVVTGLGVWLVAAGVS